MQCLHGRRETGHTFERFIVEEHLKKSHTCPLSGVQLQDITLVPNHALRNAIQEYQQKEEKDKAKRSQRQEASQRPPNGQQNIPAAPRSGGSERDVWHIDRNKIHLGEIIGGGNQGQVFEGWMENPDRSREQVAVKVVTPPSSRLSSRDMPRHSHSVATAETIQEQREQRASA
eukprot:3760756-Rhodomonas_salina.1